MRPGEELRKVPGGCFAKQIADLPDRATGDPSGHSETPGPRNPEPVPATNVKGSVAVPSVDDVAGQAVGDDSRLFASKPQPKRTMSQPLFDLE